LLLTSATNVCYKLLLLTSVTVQTFQTLVLISYQHCHTNIFVFQIFTFCSVLCKCSITMSRTFQTLMYIRNKYYSHLILALTLSVSSTYSRNGNTSMLLNSSWPHRRRRMNRLPIDGYHYWVLSIFVGHHCAKHKKIPLLMSSSDSHLYHMVRFRGLRGIWGGPKAEGVCCNWAVDS
jgi:hypothetical protein